MEDAKLVFSTVKIFQRKTLVMLDSGKSVEFRKTLEKRLYFSKTENAMESLFFVNYNLAACIRTSARILLWEERRSLAELIFDTTFLC